MSSKKTFKIYYVTAYDSYFKDEVPEDGIPDTNHQRCYELFGRWFKGKNARILAQLYAGGMKMKYNLPDEGKFAVKIFEAILKPIEMEI